MKNFQQQNILSFRISIPSPRKMFFLLVQKGNRKFKNYKLGCFCYFRASFLRTRRGNWEKKKREENNENGTNKIQRQTWESELTNVNDLLYGFSCYSRRWWFWDFPEKEKTWASLFFSWKAWEKSRNWGLNFDGEIWMESLEMYCVTEMWNL